MRPTSDATVELAWAELLETDRLHRYYGYLSHRLEKISTWLMVVATFCSGSAFFAFVIRAEFLW